jgi:uncharacterized Zn finger protein
MFYYDFPPYVPVAERRRQAERKLNELRKAGKKPSPVVIEGRNIAATFWGKSWCDNLEAYSDFDNRLPRGRTYVRNGSVIDLQIAKGKIQALVSGSEIYRIEVDIQPAPKKQWSALVRECAGKIDSVVELLSGKLSDGVMEVLCRKGSGLFPAPKEISLSCSCPDSAWLCKHLAAVLYGIGARLDHEPELLFVLRGVDQMELVSEAGTASALGSGTKAAHGLEGADLSGIFGIELAQQPEQASPKPERVAKRKKARGKRTARVSKRKGERGLRRHPRTRGRP